MPTVKFAKGYYTRLRAARRPIERETHVEETLGE